MPVSSTSERMRAVPIWEPAGVMFEVYTSAPMSGGKPMLIYPVDIDVAEPA